MLNGFIKGGVAHLVGNLSSLLLSAPSFTLMPAEHAPSPCARSCKSRCNSTLQSRCFCAAHLEGRGDGEDSQSLSFFSFTSFSYNSIFFLVLNSHLSPTPHADLLAPRAHLTLVRKLIMCCDESLKYLLID